MRILETSPGVTLSFPIPLVCPVCERVLALADSCGCAAATRLEWLQGLPRVLVPGVPEPDAVSGPLTRINRRMEEVSWTQALEEESLGEAFKAWRGSPVGAEFSYSLPWDEIGTVLEISSGMGFLSAQLARRAKRVISVESGHERALFQSKRAAQEGIVNWHPLVSKKEVLPFLPASFDLIVFDGGLEDVGKDSRQDLDVKHHRFLARAFELLKPNGILVVSGPTRFALGVGPSGPGAVGGKKVSRTPAQYAIQVKEAGFDGVDLYGALERQNRELVFYPMDDASVRRTTRNISTPPVTWKGVLHRQFADAPLWFDLLENEIVVCARKGHSGRAAAWSGLGHDGPIAQFSTANKVFALCFEVDRPTSIFVAPKSEYAREALAKEHTLLQAATQYFGAELDGWALRWPTPLGCLHCHGQTHYHYEYANGIPLARLLLPAFHDPLRFDRLLSDLFRNYSDFCIKMSAGLNEGTPERGCGELLEQLGALRIDDKVLSARVAAACACASQKSWPGHIIHGDLSLNNAIALADGTIVLVDWENADRHGLIALDLLRLLYDTWDDSRLNQKTRADLLTETRGMVRAALGRLGIIREDFPHVEALFAAHQIRLGEARQIGPEKLIRAYHERAFALEE